MNYDIKSFISKNGPITVLDIGAKGGNFSFNGMEDLSCFFCFEPNPKMLSDLSGLKSIVSDNNELNAGSVNSFPYAVTNKKDGEVYLNITRRPGGTSTLIPNEDVLKKFHEDNWSEIREIVETIKVPSITLKDFMIGTGVTSIDCIKLDTQGNELDILKSAGDLLNNISTIFVEVEFIEMYEDQPLFHDISLFLNQNGFELVDIKIDPTARRFHAKPDLPYDCYRAVWGDAVFVRSQNNLSERDLIYQGLSLVGLGYMDLAIYLFDKSKILNDNEKLIFEKFARSKAEPFTFKGKIKRMVERIFGLEIHKYDWKNGKQCNSLK